jgi:integrase
MRRGELAGLRWEDVDLEAATISVRQTRIAIGYKVEVSEPKTTRSRRSIGLDSTTVAALRSWRAQQLEERLVWGPAWMDAGMVFTREDGSPLHPEYLSRSFLRQARAAGLPRIRFHDLRHSYATASLLAGVPSKVVSARLGHASVGITLDTYSHVLREMDDEAARKIASLLFG